MSATATIAALSALLGIGLQAFEARERLKGAALTSGEITLEDLQEQDALLAGQMQRLRDLMPPQYPIAADPQQP